MLKIRLSRGGKVHCPAYSIVVAESSTPRDGKFVARIGYYQPTLPADNVFRLSLNAQDYNSWKAKGAQPTETVKKLAYKLGIESEIVRFNNPIKSAPKKKAQARAKK